MNYDVDLIVVLYHIGRFVYVSFERSQKKKYFYFLTKNSSDSLTWLWKD